MRAKSGSVTLGPLIAMSAFPPVRSGLCLVRRPHPRCDPAVGHNLVVQQKHARTKSGVATARFAVVRCPMMRSRVLSRKPLT